jgi:hypothetical protein
MNLFMELDLLDNATRTLTDRCAEICTEMRQMQEQMTTDQGCTMMNVLAVSRVSSLPNMLDAAVSVDQVVDSIRDRVELFVVGAKEVLNRSPLTQSQKTAMRGWVLQLEYEMSKQG